MKYPSTEKMVALALDVMRQERERYRLIDVILCIAVGATLAVVAFR